MDYHKEITQKSRGHRVNYRRLLSLKPKETKYTEPCGNGLNLIIYPSGRKVWSFHGRISGKVITKTLGDFPEMTETAARAEISSLNTVKVSPKLSDILKANFDLKVSNGKMLQKNADSDRRRFLEHCSALVLKRIDEITPAKAIDHLKKLSPHTARKMAQILMDCEDYAVNTEIKEHYCLQKIVKFLPKLPAVEHMTACKPSEFGEVLQGLAVCPHFNMVLFGLYTLLRESEIIAAHADWINKETNSINVPAINMKMKRPHRIPITPQIAKLLERLPQDGYLFPSPQKVGGHISRETYRRQFEQVNGLCVPHGVRSVGRSWMSDNGIRFDVAEECIAHVRGDATSRSYDRTDLLEERREVMARWCSFVDEKLPKMASDTGGEGVEQDD